jgi:hypothetical protein
MLEPAGADLMDALADGLMAVAAAGIGPLEASGAQ